MLHFVQLTFKCVHVKCFLLLFCLVKWQTLNNRELAVSFVLTLRRELLRLRTLIKVIYFDTMSRVQTLNGIHASSHQTLARRFECSGPPS